MKWGKTQIITICIVAVIIAAASFYYLTKEVANEESSTPSHLWELALDKVYQGWKGDIDLSDSQIQKNCPHFSRSDNERVPPELKACRREVFYCYFKDRKLSLKNQKNFHQLSVEFPASFLAPGTSNTSESNSIVVNLDNEKRTYEVNDFCRQVELPQGAYWGNRSSDKNKRIWHTSGVAYAVDRFLVRNIDIREWLLRERKEDIKDEKLWQRYRESNSPLSWFRPSVDLTPQQMGAFCRFRGGEVLSSKVRAAITFHHGRTQKNLIGTEPPSFNSPPHPFGLRQQDSPQYRLSHNKEESPEVKKDDCRLIYGKECVSFPYYELFPNSLGWSGVSELFGGPAEYVSNLEHPRKNLHPSSYYHSVSSPVHQAGVRVYWAGNGHRRIDFNFFTEAFFETSAKTSEGNEEDYYDVGFRCMKKRILSL